MPELPEVETIRRTLEREIVGAQIADVKVSPRWASLPHTQFQGSREFRRRLVGRRIERLARRGKFLLMGLDEGWLVVHLGMSGQLVVDTPPIPNEPETRNSNHTHARFRLTDGRELRFNDPRTFGVLQTAGDLSQCASLRQMGPEPLDDRFTWRDLAAALRAKKTKIKAALLDQRVVAGIGNIYADEALWEARTHPERRCAHLSDVEVRRLFLALRKVLRRAVRDNGTSFDAVYLHGGYAPKVYACAGNPCRRCRTPIQRGILSGRSFHFCPRCQRSG